MKDHKKYKELLQLAVYDELSEEEQNELDNHLFECDECRTEYDSVSKLYNVVTQNQNSLPDDALLVESRNELLAKLSLQEPKKSFSEKLAALFSRLFTARYVWIAPSFTMLILGLVLGPYLYQPQIAYQQGVSVDKLSQEDISNGNIEISDIRFTNPFDTEGEIEIDLNLFRPISLKGNYNDPKMKSLMAKAILSKGNAGLRIRTLNEISDRTRESAEPDPLVKEALITTLKADANPGVRREALNLLLKYNYDYKVRNVLLYILSNDNNPGIRIAAINALSEFRSPDISVDENLKNILQNKAENDENNYIRLRAASILQEEK